MLNTTFSENVDTEYEYSTDASYRTNYYAVWGFPAQSGLSPAPLGELPVSLGYVSAEPGL